MSLSTEVQGPFCPTQPTVDSDVERSTTGYAWPDESRTSTSLPTSDPAVSDASLLGTFWVPNYALLSESIELAGHLFTLNFALVRVGQVKTRPPVTLYRLTSYIRTVAQR